MLDSAAISCILILIGRFDLPESSRWLLRKGQVKECEAMMTKLFGGPMVFDEEVPQETRFLQLLNRRHSPFVLFVAAIRTCQVIPMFIIYTFGPQIAGLLGLGAGESVVLGNMMISLCFMLGRTPPMFWLNSAGRQSLLIGSFIMTALALAVLGLIPDMGARLVVLAFAVHASFSRGSENLQWLYPNELLPTDIHVPAVGVVISLSHIGTIVSIWTLSVSITKYGIGNVMLIDVEISLIDPLVSIVFAPGTRGLTPTQASQMTVRSKLVARTSY